MRSGFVGQRTRRRSRYRFFFLFIILLIGTIIYFVYPAENINEEIVEIEGSDLKIEDISLIKKIEKKLLETEQKLLLRNNLINSLKVQIGALENNNDEFMQALKLINIENEDKELKFKKLQKNNLVKIEQLQELIINLNEEIKKINDNYVSIKKENNMLTNKIDIIENNNNTLKLQKNISFEQIEELKQNVIGKDKLIIEKDKLIIEKDKLIKEMKDKIHH